jgi:hypothetical protein
LEAQNAQWAVAEATTLLLCRKLPEAQNQTAQPNGVDPVPFTLGTLAGTGKASRVYRQHSRADRARPDAQRASGQGRRGATSSAFRSEKMRAGSEGRAGQGRAGHMHPACGVQCRRYEAGVGRVPRTAPAERRHPMMPASPRRRSPSLAKGKAASAPCASPMINRGSQGCERFDEGKEP